MDVPITNAGISSGVPCRYFSAILYWHTYTDPFPISPILEAVHSTGSIHSAYGCRRIYDNSLLHLVSPEIVPLLKILLIFFAYESPTPKLSQYSYPGLRADKNTGNLIILTIDFRLVRTYRKSQKIVTLRILRF